MNGANSVHPELIILDYWDALLSGSSDLPEIEPGMSETIAWLSDHDDLEGPSPEYVVRSRDRFATEKEEQPTLIAIPEATVRPQEPPIPRIDDAVWKRWAIWPIAAVICLALGLGSLVEEDSLPGWLTDLWSDDPAVPVVFAPTTDPTTQVATPVAPATPASTPEVPVEARTDMPMLLANPARLGDTGITGPVGEVEVAWLYKSEFRIRSSPAVADGVMFIGNSNGQLFALDASNGGMVWQFDAEGSIDSTTLVAGDLVVVAAADMARSGFVIALDRATGIEAWRFPIGDQVTSDPVFYEGLVYLGSDDGLIYALDPEDGSAVWTVDTGAPVAFPAAIDSGVLVVGNRAGVLFALDAATGEERWILEPDLASLVSDPADVSEHAWSTPLIADGRAIIAYRPIAQASIAPTVAYAVDLHSGEVEWLRTDLLGTGPVVFLWDDGVVRVLVRSIAHAAVSIVSFNPADGEPAGDPVPLTLSNGAELTGGVIAGNTLYVYVGASPTNSSSGSSSQGRLHVYDLATGELMGRVELPGTATGIEVADRRPPIVNGETVYLGTASGEVVAFRTTVASPEAARRPEP